MNGLSLILDLCGVIAWSTMAVLTYAGVSQWSTGWIVSFLAMLALSCLGSAIESLGKLLNVR